MVGTDIAHAVPLTLVAGIGHATLGHVDWALLGALLVGSHARHLAGRAAHPQDAREARARPAVPVAVTAGLKVIH